MSQTDTVSGITSVIDKEMVRDLISKMKNGKAAGPLGVVSEMVKAAGEEEVDMIINLVNQIIVEGIILTKWKLSTIGNSNKGKGNSLKSGNYRGLKLVDQILN